MSQTSTLIKILLYLKILWSISPYVLLYFSIIRLFFRFTICTVWLNSSRSAVMEVIWSIRRCFRVKKCSRRLLSERQDATLDLYSSFSFLTTVYGEKFLKKKTTKYMNHNIYIYIYISCTWQFYVFKTVTEKMKRLIPCLTVADG